MKKAIVDIPLVPLFTLVLVIGLVLPAVIRATTEVGTPMDLAKQYYSADLALLIDSIYAVRPDVNLHYVYLTRKELSHDIQHSKVTIYEETPEDGRTFLYTQDVNVRQNTLSLSKGTTSVHFYKTRDALTIGAMKQFNLAKPTCAPAKQTVKAKLNTLDDLSKAAIIATGDATITARIRTGIPTAKFYISNNDHAGTACAILHNIFVTTPLTGSVIIPVEDWNSYSTTNPLYEVALGQTNIHIELTIPDTYSATRARAELYAAIKSVTHE